jgi:hypothetical protein
VDISVPSSAKADFHLSSAWGNMFTDLDLDVEYETVSGTEENQEEKREKYAHRLDAKYNGGGVDFNIKSTHGDIYLRKK